MKRSFQGPEVEYDIAKSRVPLLLCTSGTRGRRPLNPGLIIVIVDLSSLGPLQLLPHHRLTTYLKPVCRAAPSSRCRLLIGVVVFPPFLIP